MNELTISWGESDKATVKSEIERLFRLKGYRMPEKNLAELAVLFTEEMATTGKPVRAVLNGIHKLKFERMTRIDINDLIDAAEEHMEPDDLTVEICEDCKGIGRAVMLDSEHRYFSMACHCRNGDRFTKKGGLARWNGEKQVDRGNGRILTKADQG